MYAEYEKLIDSDFADVRNTSKDGCGAITADLFLPYLKSPRISRMISFILAKPFGIST